MDSLPLEALRPMFFRFLFWTHRAKATNTMRTKIIAPKIIPTIAKTGKPLFEWGELLSELGAVWVPVPPPDAGCLGLLRDLPGGGGVKGGGGGAGLLSNEFPSDLFYVEEISKDITQQFNIPRYTCKQNNEQSLT